MKIYKVSYIAEDDLYYSMFFTSKKDAEKNQRRLLKEAKQEEKETDIYGAYIHAKQIFDIEESNIELTKAGIIRYLNAHFGQLGSY